MLPKKFSHLLDSVDSDITFGCEFEFYANCNRSDLAEMMNTNGMECTNDSDLTDYTRWHCKSDGSLNHRPNGFNTEVEVTSPILKGAEGLVSIYNFLKLISSNNIAKVNKSCGGHVHFGSFGNDISIIRNIYNLYERHETLLDSIVSRSRRGSPNYSHSILDVGLKNISDEKYYKLSFRNFTRYGTFENRHHQGSLNFQNIASWIILNQQIINYSRRNSGVFTMPDLRSFIGTLAPNLGWLPEFFSERQLYLAS